MKNVIFENIFRSNEVSFNDEGITVCPYCNGTGLNAEFNLFNKVMEKMQIAAYACCLKCYGKKHADWVEFANGRIDEILEYLYRYYRKFDSEALGHFFSYVYAGYLVHGDGSTTIRYNEDADQWEEMQNFSWRNSTPSEEKVLHWINSTSSEEEVLHWINEFRNNYDIKDFDFIPYKLAEEYGYESGFNDRFIDKIKSEILDATELGIEDLQRMKDNLELFDYTIAVSNEDDIAKARGSYLDSDKEFTWENLLKRFDIPRIHKYSPVPRGVLIFD